MVEGIGHGKKPELEWEKRGEAIPYEQVPVEVIHAVMEAMMSQPFTYTGLQFRRTNYGGGVVEYTALGNPNDPLTDKTEPFAVTVRTEDARVTGTTTRKSPSWFKDSE